MLIAHISDLHLVATPEPATPIRADLIETIRKVVADIAAFRPAIDVVVLSGDLTNNGSREEYALLNELFSPVADKVLAVCGNHDVRSNFRQAFAGRLPMTDGETIQYERLIGDCRFLALDTVIPGSLTGQLAGETLAWLKQKLAQPFPGHTTIIMHHPPYVSGIGFFDRIGLMAGHEEFAALIAQYPGTLNILCGHIHRPSQSLWQGAFVAAAGSPAFEVELSLHEGGVEPPCIEAPYAYFIYRVAGNGEFAVHPRYVPLARYQCSKT